MRWRGWWPPRWRSVPGTCGASRGNARDALVLALAAGLAACGGGGAVIDWDLASSHTRADVDWSSGESDGRQIDDVKSIRFRLPGNLVVEERNGIEQMILDREGYLGRRRRRLLPRRDGGSGHGIGPGTWPAGTASTTRARSTVSCRRCEPSAPRAPTRLPVRRPGPGTPTTIGSVRMTRHSKCRSCPGGISGGTSNCAWTGGRATPSDWDLSKTHTVADVGHPFPADGSAEAYVPNITQLRIGLPEDQEFRIEDRAGEVRMTRSGDVITKLAASFGEPTPQEAHRLALDLADEWRAPIAACRQLAGRHHRGGRSGQGVRTSGPRSRRAPRRRRPHRGRRPALRTPLLRPGGVPLGRRLRPYLAGGFPRRLSGWKPFWRCRSGCSRIVPGRREIFPSRSRRRL